MISAIVVSHQSRELLPRCLSSSRNAREEAGRALECTVVDCGSDDGGPELVAPGLHYPDGRRQFGWAPGSSVLGEALQRVRIPFEDAAWNHGVLPRLLRVLFGAGFYSAACLLVRRSAFEGVGGFDEDFFLYFEDSDLCLRLTRAGWRFDQVPDAAVGHAKGASENERTRSEYRRSQWRFYRKHRPVWERRIVETRIRRHLPAEEWPWHA